MPASKIKSRPDDYNARQADLMAKKSAERRTVTISKCKDKERRERLEADDCAWLLHYFALESGTEQPFTYQFTEQQVEMISAIRNAIANGDDQALAASRGEGKTTIAERLLLKYALQGIVRFAVLFAATGGAAEDSLKSIMAEIDGNDHLCADYPEVCEPVQALENTPQKAHSQIVQGHRHDTGEAFGPVLNKFSWCGQEIYLPSVPGSPSSGGIIATRGLDSAVRGLKKKGRRVDLAVIDDPDTEDTARSEEQAKKLLVRIDRAIGGLGGQKRRCARVVLTTLQSRLSASYTLTDPMQKASFKGRRFRFLISKPANGGLWEEFVQLQEEDWRKETTLAHEHYVANREEMDLGAVVSNPNRYMQGQLSALQFYYSEVARIGPVSVATEYDNDPPAETGPVESGITPARIQKQLNELPEGIIPPGCNVLTVGIDVGKYWLHFVVRAWEQATGTGHTIHYGTAPVYDTVKGIDDAAMDRAITHAIKALVGQLRDNARGEGKVAYRKEDGELVPLDLVLVDAGYRTEAVYAATASLGTGVYPIMGFGKSSGCAQIRFSPARAANDDTQVGDGQTYKIVRKGEGRNRVWLVEADVDKWKAWEHDRWMSSRGNPGCMYLWGERSAEDGNRLSKDEKAHYDFAQQICNEVEIEEPYKDGIRRGWKKKPGENHKLDASVYCDIAGRIKGVKLAGTSKEAKPRKSLADMAKEARGAA